MVIAFRFLRVVLAVAQVLFLIGAVLLVMGCSGGPTAPSSSQPSVAIVPFGALASSFWVGIRSDPIDHDVVEGKGPPRGGPFKFPET